MIDIAIIGSGVAGCEAAINCKIRNKNILLIGNDDLSEKLIKAPNIKNYLGFPDISGVELRNNIKNHLKQMEIPIKNTIVKSVYAMGDYFTIQTKEEMIDARAVIIATGLSNITTIKGEEEFLGRGVGYCATCDAPLYKNKDVVVIGDNEEAIHEARYISEIAKNTYFVTKNQVSIPNVKIINDTPIEIKGLTKANTLIMKNSTITADGFFILRNSYKIDNLVPGLEIENNHIVVDKNMQTNLEGLFACGDITGAPYQYMKACGEGLIAGLKASEYVSKI